MASLDLRREVENSSAFIGRPSMSARRTGVRVYLHYVHPPVQDLSEKARLGISRLLDLGDPIARVLDDREPRPSAIAAAVADDPSSDCARLMLPRLMRKSQDAVEGHGMGINGLSS